MPCKEQKTKKYQSRPSPPFPAQECKGVIKKGKDGTYVSKADRRGIYKWVKMGKTTGNTTGNTTGKTSNKTQKRKGKSYDIHDNGSRPFRVYVDGSTVSIYQANRDHTGWIIDGFDTMFRTMKVKKVYLGGKKSQLGNSIVIHLSGNHYMYIGHEIYEFEMEDDIDSYFSLIGNSDVPYPVLLGTTYVYFMLDHCYVSRNEFDPTMTNAEWEDAYARYYGFTDPMTGNPSEHKKTMKGKKMKGFHMIVKRK